jgi:actin-like ATPase involved in cell morphogenesis
MFKEIVMTGGGALLKGLDQLVGSELGMAVKVAEDPLSSVVSEPERRWNICICCRGC